MCLRSTNCMFNVEPFEVKLKTVHARYYLIQWFIAFIFNHWLSGKLYKIVCIKIVLSEFQWIQWNFRLKMTDQHPFYSSTNVREPIKIVDFACLASTIFNLSIFCIESNTFEPMKLWKEIWEKKWEEKLKRFFLIDWLKWKYAFKSFRFIVDSENNFSIGNNQMRFTWTGNFVFIDFEFLYLLVSVILVENLQVAVAPSNLEREWFALHCERPESQSDQNRSTRERERSKIQCKSIIINDRAIEPVLVDDRKRETNENRRRQKKVKQNTIWLVSFNLAKCFRCGEICFLRHFVWRKNIKTLNWTRLRRDAMRTWNSHTTTTKTTNKKLKKTLAVADKWLTLRASNGN